MISHEQHSESITQFMDAGTLTGNEMQITSKSGEKHFIILDTDPVEINGQPFAFTSMIDITVWKRAEENLLASEQRFLAIVEQAAVGVAQVESKPGRFIRIIAQTAHASPEECEKALQAGCDDFITKPFYLKELLEVLSRNIK